jgi:DNA-binding transcriptional LysR family regulator
MELRHLRYFVGIAETGILTTASEQTPVIPELAQASVSIGRIPSA